MQIISWIIGTLLQWYIWMPIVAVLMFLTWRNYRKIEDFTPVESVLLVLEIPRTNDKQELAAEQLFASLHGILRDNKELRLSGGHQEHISFEIASVNGQIRFYVWVPKTLQSFVEGQIYSQYPTVQIHQADEDYTEHERDHEVAYSTELTLTTDEFLPIRTFQNFEVDPLAGITGTLAKLETTGEELWIQVLVRPIPDDWQNAADRYINNIKNGRMFSLPGFGGSMQWLIGVLGALWQPPEQGANQSTAVELSDRDKTRISEAEKKATKLGYEVKIRLVYMGESQTNAKLRMQALVGTFKQFNSTNLNGFHAVKGAFGKEFIDKYRKRSLVTVSF